MSNGYTLDAASYVKMLERGLLPEQSPVIIPPNRPKPSLMKCRDAISFNVDDIDAIDDTSLMKRVCDRLNEEVIKTMNTRKELCITGMSSYMGINVELALEPLVKYMHGTHDESYRVLLNRGDIDSILHTRGNGKWITSSPLDIDRVIFNDPATIVIWKDGTKTVVKAQPGESYDKEKGLALAISKKALGNKGNYNNIFKKYIIGGKDE